MFDLISEFNGYDGNLIYLEIHIEEINCQHKCDYFGQYYTMPFWK
jgi:hypothetical protein